jgi:hypothetical protein
MVTNTTSFTTIYEYKSRTTLWSHIILFCRTGHSVHKKENANIKNFSFKTIGEHIIMFWNAQGQYTEN